LTFGEQERQQIGSAFAEVIAAERYTCYACAIMPDHVHVLLRKHKHSAETMIEALKQGSRARLIEKQFRLVEHPTWTEGGWKVFLEHPDEVRRTICYIEKNPLPLGRDGPILALRHALRWLAPSSGTQSRFALRQAPACVRPLPVSVACPSAAYGLAGPWWNLAPRAAATFFRRTARAGSMGHMSPSESTCWTVIHGAAAGGVSERDEFARRYAPVLRAYLMARWRDSPCRHDVDDAVQQVFVECFRPDGVLVRAERGRGFRAFLYGVVHNVALRVESEHARRRERQPPSDVDLGAVADPEPSQEHLFDRAWARALLREAAQQHERNARRDGEAACRRVELLRLRFHEGLPIRDIASRWHEDAATLHRQYATAREEFRVALMEVVAFHHPGTPAEVERECAELLSLLR
jgi:RNA polymerase sigma-70 factor (ECF subfamily)